MTPEGREPDESTLKRDGVTGVMVESHGGQAVPFYCGPGMSVIRNNMLYSCTSCIELSIVYYCIGDMAHGVVDLRHPRPAEQRLSKEGTGTRPSGSSPPTARPTKSLWLVCACTIELVMRRGAS